MTRDEALEICFDVFQEYLPKTIKKAVKMEVADTLLRELEGEGLFELDEDYEEEEVPEDVSSYLNERDLD